MYLKFNDSELKHVHHQKKLFLTGRIIVCKISAIKLNKCNKWIKYKNILPNHKNANIGSCAIEQWTAWDSFTWCKHERRVDLLKTKDKNITFLRQKCVKK